jgi:hypothetical protein
MIKVKDLMVDFSQCPKVSEDATLRDAVLSLEATRLIGDPWTYRPRVILVHDKDENIVGTLRHFEVLKALEPKYRQVIEELEAGLGQSFQLLDSKHGSARDRAILFLIGLDCQLVDSVSEKYCLWKDLLQELGRKAAIIKVKDIMSVPGEGEIIDDNASLREAIHKLLVGNHLSLVVRCVTGNYVGILRLSDVFNEACQAIKMSEL